MTQRTLESSQPSFTPDTRPTIMAPFPYYMEDNTLSVRGEQGVGAYVALHLPEPVFFDRMPGSPIGRWGKDRSPASIFADVSARTSVLIGETPDGERVFFALAPPIKSKAGRSPYDAPVSATLAREHAVRVVLLKALVEAHQSGILSQSDFLPVTHGTDPITALTEAQDAYTGWKHSMLPPALVEARSKRASATPLRQARIGTILPPIRTVAVEGVGDRRAEKSAKAPNVRGAYIIVGGTLIVTDLVLSACGPVTALPTVEIKTPPPSVAAPTAGETAIVAPTEIFLTQGPEATPAASAAYPTNLDYNELKTLVAGQGGELPEGFTESAEVQQVIALRKTWLDQSGVAYASVGVITWGSGDTVRWDVVGK